MNLNLNLDDQLIQASKDGDLSQVKSLIIEGAIVHAWDDEALRYAAERGHLEIVKYLVEECGANVHAKDDYALHLAADRGHLGIVKYLKSYILSQFTKKHIDKQNLRYVFQQYELPFDIQQLISSYVLNKGRTDHLLIC